MVEPKFGDIVDDNALCLCVKMEYFFDCSFCNFKRGDTLIGKLNNYHREWEKEFISSSSGDCYMRNSMGCDKDCSSVSNINAHSISKSIHFKGFGPWVEIKSLGVNSTKGFDWRVVGLKKVTTFNGVCGYHDKLFEILDKNEDNYMSSKSYSYQAFYRQILYHLYKSIGCRFEFEKKMDFIYGIKRVANINLVNVVDFEYLEGKYKQLIAEIKRLGEWKILIERSLCISSQKKIEFNGVGNLLYVVDRDLKKGFEVNISTIHIPRLKVNGSCFEYNKLNGGDVYFFVSNSAKGSRLIMACESTDKDLIEYINDFTSLPNVEEIILKHFGLFHNAYMSNRFYLKALTDYNRDLIIMMKKNILEIDGYIDRYLLYFKHSNQQELDSIFIKLQKEKHNRLSLNVGISFDFD